MRAKSYSSTCQCTGLTEAVPAEEPPGDTGVRRIDGRRHRGTVRYQMLKFSGMRHHETCAVDTDSSTTEHQFATMSLDDVAGDGETETGTAIHRGSGRRRGG